MDEAEAVRGIAKAFGPLVPLTPEKKAVKRLGSLSRRAKNYLDELFVADSEDVEYGWRVAWQTQSRQCLRDLAGPQHEYTQAFDNFASGEFVNNIQAGRFLLEALSEDIHNGYFNGFREMVHADMFSDFLDMGQHLLENGGYKDAAAVMAGGVLEEHMRKLCQKNGIPIEVEKRGEMAPKTAEVMNHDLAREGVYSKTDQKAVLLWLGIRNDAVHANYEKYAADQVELMIQGLRQFVARYPA